MVPIGFQVCVLLLESYGQFTRTRMHQQHVATYRTLVPPSRPWRVPLLPASSFPWTQLERPNRTRATVTAWLAPLAADDRPGNENAGLRKRNNSLNPLLSTKLKCRPSW